MHLIQDYLHIFTALFVIVNPVGAIPLFINYTSGQSSAEQRHIAQVTGIAVAAILILSIFVGEPLLRFFGIGIPSFRVGGGICILLMAVAMLDARTSEARSTSEERLEAEDKDSVAVVPLAIPILAGPGAISTMIVYAHRAHSHWDLPVLALISLVIAFLTGALLYLSEPIARRLGNTGINIATRIMGLILAAVAVEFIAAGLGELFPALGNAA
jgi:multiple antibiotic resistance protein